MANTFDPTPEQLAGYHEWVASRPENVRPIAARFKPWELYRLKTTGHRVAVYSFGEADDGKVSLTVIVSSKYNFTMFERRVFGISPDDLEPCDLPDPMELTEALLTTDEQIHDYVDSLKKDASGPQGI